MTITRKHAFRDLQRRIDDGHSATPKTFSMTRLHRNEQQNILENGPPHDRYFPTREQIESLHTPCFGVNEKGQKAINLQGKPADGKFIFVITSHDQLRICQSTISRPAHSYLAEFQPVKYAGELMLKNGRIEIDQNVSCLEGDNSNILEKGINLNSGHYMPPRNMGYLLLEKFRPFIDYQQFDETIEDQVGSKWNILSPCLLWKKRRNASEKKKLWIIIFLKNVKKP